MKLIIWRIKLVFWFVIFNYASTKHLIKAFQTTKQDCWTEYFYYGYSAIDTMISVASSDLTSDEISFP